MYDLAAVPPCDKGRSGADVTCIEQQGRCLVRSLVPTSWWRHMHHPTGGATGGATPGSTRGRQWWVQHLVRVLPPWEALAASVGEFGNAIEALCELRCSDGGWWACGDWGGSTR